MQSIIAPENVIIDNAVHVIWVIDENRHWTVYELTDNIILLAV